MNYCVVAFGVILLIAVVTWIFDGRKNYKGPHIDVEGLKKEEVEGVKAASTENVDLSNKGVVS